MNKRILRAGLGAFFVATLAACGEIAEGVPETISFRMDGEAGTEVTLIFSKEFIAARNEAGQTTVSVLLSDTVVRALPVDTVLDIAAERRFFVMAIPAEDGVGVGVRIDVNDRNIFSDQGDLFIAEPWRFVYLYNQFFAQDVDVVF